jgi:non-canonical (house-cleaning) NTP pyrophosphatase
LIVAIGSTRGPKVEAVRRALTILKERFPGFFREDLRLIARAVRSGTASTPLSTAELMEGAQTRAQGLFEILSEEGTVPALSIGLEGGLRSETADGIDQRVVSLEAWAYATDGVSGYFGSSGCLPLPDELVHAVVERGEDLGPAADKFYGQQDVAGRQGTFGVLTADLVTREEAFVRALLHALAPFYNASAYAARTTEKAQAKRHPSPPPQTPPEA